MERISIANPVFRGNEKKYLNECIDTGWVSANGRFIEEFQNQFAAFCGSRYALACSNGTVTLHLALIALGIGPGDEVIMPTLTYIATANAVRMVGAKPVFADSDPDTWNVDPAAVERAITPRTKAIIPVHLYGLSCDMTAIMDIADRHHIPVLEDAAEAHGAKWKGRMVGSMGAIGSFSFFGNKIITSGEGGMLVTDDEALYNTMKLYRSQGVDPSQKRYWHVVSGYNYRMTNLQAAGVKLYRTDLHGDIHCTSDGKTVSFYTEKTTNADPFAAPEIPSPEPEDVPAVRDTPDSQEDEPTETAPGQEYVVNKNTKKFHYPTCSSADEILPKNRWEYTGTRDELIDMGYKPCKRCNP